MLIRQMRTAIAVVAFTLIIGAASNPAHADRASSHVASFQASLLEVMKNAKNTTVRQRYDELAPTIEKTFHVPLMTQIAVGRHWATTEKAQKSVLIDAFRRMSVATLATLFDGYSGESFVVTGERPGPSKTVIVSTNLVKSDNSKVSIAYVAREFGNAWRLIDVVVDNGISELKVRRSEYNQVLKQNGVKGLIDLLNGKADDLMSR